MTANFLTGPVAMTAAVRAAFAGAPISHRAGRFTEMMARTRSLLQALTQAPHAVALLGSGTLANDAVAAQLRQVAAIGVILANGEFGDRLVDHATRAGLEFKVVRQRWGLGFDWGEVRHEIELHQPAWVWAVLHETSTGIENPLPELQAAADRVDADLCVDAISAIGLRPLDLSRVRFATAVSGKGLAAFPGIAIVFHDGRLARTHRMPRYLDLAHYEDAGSVPFTHSSNLLAALDCALSTTDWRAKYQRIRCESRTLRDGLRRHALAPLAPDEVAAPGIVTVPIPVAVSALAVARSLREKGIEVAHESGYLQRRNWLQVCLMGEFDDTRLAELPALLAHGIASFGAGVYPAGRLRRAS